MSVAYLLAALILVVGTVVRARRDEAEALLENLRGPASD